jgi:hypothetical protein
MYDGISQALDEKNEYLEYYEIENFGDINESKINFYYILIKFILKNTIYIFNIPFLMKNLVSLWKLKEKAGIVSMLPGVIWLSPRSFPYGTELQTTNVSELICTCGTRFPKAVVWAAVPPRLWQA